MWRQRVASVFLSDWSFYMHHPTDRITHTTVCFSPAAVTGLGCNICCRGISLTKSRAIYCILGGSVSHLIGLLFEIRIIRGL